ncbi:MAG TPA: (2Fe-2S) ferredoxin domain-containing protein [Pirellulales bacterium]|nr:(2Fe-2S) ferredoxin domain-containing protein [Pirellulales bacterium]
MNDALTSRTQSQLGQIFLCRGCCCGQTQRGMSDVPVERIKAVWKAEKLNRSIQLTVSGCLGPCDLPNVVLVLTPNGAEWLANVSGDALYETLIDWSRACHAEGRLLPLPAAFDGHRLERFLPGGAT